MLAGNKALVVLEVCLHAAVRRVMSPSDICQVYNFDGSLAAAFTLLLQPLYIIFECSSSPDQQRKCCHQAA